MGHKSTIVPRSVRLQPHSYRWTSCRLVAASTVALLALTVATCFGRSDAASTAPAFDSAASKATEAETKRLGSRRADLIVTRGLDLWRKGWFSEEDGQRSKWRGGKSADGHEAKREEKHEGMTRELAPLRRIAGTSWEKPGKTAAVAGSLMEGLLGLMVDAAGGSGDMQSAGVDREGRERNAGGRGLPVSRRLKEEEKKKGKETTTKGEEKEEEKRVKGSAQDKRREKASQATESKATKSGVKKTSTNQQKKTKRKTTKEKRTSKRKQKQQKKRQRRHRGKKRSARKSKKTKKGSSGQKKKKTKISEAQLENLFDVWEVQEAKEEKEDDEANHQLALSEAHKSASSSKSKESSDDPARIQRRLNYLFQRQGKLEARKVRAQDLKEKVRTKRIAGLNRRLAKLEKRITSYCKKWKVQSCESTDAPSPPPEAPSPTSESPPSPPPPSPTAPSQASPPISLAPSPIDVPPEGPASSPTSSAPSPVTPGAPPPIVPAFAPSPDDGGSPSSPGGAPGSV